MSTPTLPPDINNLCRQYDDHIFLSAEGGYPLAVSIRTAYRAWQASHSADDLERLSAGIREYHRLYEAGRMCDCGQEHVMPGYRVCHPCAFARATYPWVFEDDEEPDMLPVVPPEQAPLL